MKKALVVLLLIMAPTLSFSKPATRDKPPADAVELQPVLAQVRLALADVQKRLDDNGIPPLESVTLTLQTGGVTQVGAQIKLWILTLGHSVERERTQQVAIVLTPPSLAEAKQVAKQETLYEQLVRALVGAGTAAHAAQLALPQLVVDRVETELAFRIAKDTKGGGSIAFLPVTLDLSAEGKSSAIHKIKVSYAQKKSGR